MSMLSRARVLHESVNMFNNENVRVGHAKHPPMVVPLDILIPQNVPFLYVSNTITNAYNPNIGDVSSKK